MGRILTYENKYIICIDEQLTDAPSTKKSHSPSVVDPLLIQYKQISFSHVKLI